MVDRIDAVTLATLGGGSAAELFEEELQRVLANIADPNTEAEARREVRLQILIKPNGERDAGTVAIKASSRLAPIKPAAAQLYFGRRAGKLVAVEKNPHQLDFDNVLEGEEEEVVDERTGEIISIQKGAKN